MSLCPACRNGDHSFCYGRATCTCDQHVNLTVPSRWPPRPSAFRLHTCIATQTTSDGSVLPPCEGCLRDQELAQGFQFRGPQPLVDWKQAAKDLWQLLDDIDTLGDSMHPEVTAYFERVNRIAEKRHRILHSDGYELKSWPPPPPEKKD